ncbi:MAG: inorganic triphosphatase [Burkholderiales bacterium]|nr:inorganic triphosphatase [Burkholderiales bacterium]
MSVEIELKYQVPAAQLTALRRALATPGARRQPMAARYFDTDGQHLAAARVALRLRREGQHWVQTLKCEPPARAAAGPLLRLEHNVPVAGAVAEPELARHAGTEAGERLAQVLAAAAGADGTPPPLRERYATEVSRITRIVRHQGATVELALDVGELRAGGRSAPVCELEFELLAGPPQGLLALAARWVTRFGLVLDLRSKSERGSLLAAAQAVSAPTMAVAPALQPRMPVAQALQHMVRSALAQVLPNASALQAGVGTPEHLHQLRVGLRRLRSVARLFGAHWPELASAAEDPALAQLWRGLGAARDRDVLADSVLPALLAAGAPAMDWPPAAGSRAPAASELLAVPDLQLLWLRLLALAMGAPAGAAAAPARAGLLPALKALQRRVRRDARRFEQLDDAARHRLRRRIKRLRYGLELLSTLLPRRRLARLLQALREAQDALGDSNDASLALQACRQQVATDPRAWFAVGWLSARAPVLRAASAEAVRPLARRLRVAPRGHKL